jgi:3-deoxy-manno-octulosonate cytidylyltransferase (CMP-KDO synthetase)
VRMNACRAAVVLPARYHSTRFPGKPLAVLNGKPLIEWVYRRAAQISGVSRVVVATDHEQIAAVAKAIGGDVVMTSQDHRTGTDRVAEVARSLDEEIIVNLQGDEPVFPVGLIEEMIEVLAADDQPQPVDIVTACHPIVDPNELANANAVKVVMDRAGRALYFSRAAVPHVSEVHGNHSTAAFRHIGIYVFRKSSLLKFAELPSGELEKAEGLEQLRALENGMKIHVVKTEYETVGVDVPEDIKNVEKALPNS